MKNAPKRSDIVFFVSNRTKGFDSREKGSTLDKGNGRGDEPN